MEKELNYLSEKIEKVEHDINLCEFGLTLNASTLEELHELQSEKRMLEDILNKLTEMALVQMTNPDEVNIIAANSVKM